MPAPKLSPPLCQPTMAAPPRPPAGYLPLFWRALPGPAIAAALPWMAALAGVAHPAVLGAVTLASLLLGTAWLQWQLLKPLRRLHEQASQVAGGQPSLSPCPQRQDELGRMGHHLQQLGWSHQLLRRDIRNECSGLELVGQQLIDAQQLMLRGLQHQQHLLDCAAEPPSETRNMPAMQALLQSCDTHQASRHTLVQLHALVDELRDMAAPGQGHGEMAISTARLTLAAQRARGVLAQTEQACAALQRIGQLLGQLRDTGQADRLAALDQVRSQQAMQGRLVESSLRALEAMVRHARQMHALSRQMPAPSPEAGAAHHPFAD